MSIRIGLPKTGRAAPPKTVAIIGGGFAGSLFALKLGEKQPDWTILLIEAGARLGRGIAYGACAPQHLLNVPVTRVETGLSPTFREWLQQKPGVLPDVPQIDGLADAFVPRQLFGRYLEERIGAVLSFGRSGVRQIQGTAVAIEGARRRVVLADGRHFAVDCAVLATGHLPPAAPLRMRASPRIVVDPWKKNALGGIAPEASILIAGSGLTMVDTVQSLRAGGHRGSMEVISRHGLLPRAHCAGGAWPAFAPGSKSPVEALRAVRAAVRHAQMRGIPWQRVFDALRPGVATIWSGWSIGQRAQFLRHLRTLWDVHRHRMAESVAALIQGLVDDGILRVRAAKLLALDEHKSGVTAFLRPTGARAIALEADVFINCTGPRLDLREASEPLLKQLLADGLIRPDPLGVGLESEDCAVRNAEGNPSEWLFALGGLTRPAFWEITAVPEITAQIGRLVEKLAIEMIGADDRPLPEVFMDIGAGI